MEFTGIDRLALGAGRILAGVALAGWMVSSTALAQDQGGGTTTGSSVFCIAPVTSATGGTGPTATQFNCTAAGATAQAPVNVQFSSEAGLGLNDIHSNTDILLPDEISSGLQSGEMALRNFFTLSGGILTVDLRALAADTPLPAMVTTPPGSLVNQIRIQVRSAVVGGGDTPTIVFSGVVLGAAESGGSGGDNGGGDNGGGDNGGTGGGGTGGSGGMALIGPTADRETPLRPNLFGELTGRAAAVSLAFTDSESFTFPGLGSTPVGGGNGTGTGDDDQPASAEVTSVGVLVAGAFASIGPSGVATVSLPTGGITPPPPTPSDVPVINLGTVPSQTFLRRITLDASQSTAADNGPLTFSWSVSPAATVSGGDTATPTIEFRSGGAYQITVTATDSKGKSSSASFQVLFVTQQP
jgi:hypothetical protein